MPSSTVATTRCAAVGTPAASITSFANAFEPSSRAASARGPKQRTPSAASASASPATSGASGPTTTRSTPASRAARASAAGSSPGASSGRASRRMPALPGAHSSSGACGDRSSVRTSACSRPPEPTTRTLTRGRSDRPDEVVDRDRGERLVAGGPARAELERHARHRLLVGRLDDADEVDVPERRPLRLDRRAELLDLAVDLADPRRVVLDRLDALGGQRAQHDVGRHRAAPLARGCKRSPFYPIAGYSAAMSPRTLAG